ncbi:MAG: DMT family transporter [Elusimicrobia bacterium]|nr:DMT family transporter [Elusimicrobiota bacterium]
MRFLLAAAAILCLSQPANLVRWAHAPLEVIGFWRLLAAAAVLAPWAWRRRASWRGLAPEERRLTLLAGGFFFLHLASFFYAATHTRIASAVTAFSTHPVWTAAGGMLLFKDGWSWRLAAAYALASIGVWALFAGAIPSEGAAGDWAALASAALFSGYVLCGRRVRGSLDNLVFAGLVYAVTAGLFLVWGLSSGVTWTGYPLRTWLSIAGLALGVTLGGHALFSYLLGLVDTNVLSLSKLLEPVLAALTAYLFFGEALTPGASWAFACIAAALVVLAFPPREDFS